MGILTKGSKHHWSKKIFGFSLLSICVNEPYLLTCLLIPHHFYVKSSSFLIRPKLDMELTLIGFNNVY